MRIVGQKNGGIVAALAAGAIMAQLGATRVVAESSAHKATTSCLGGSTGITLPSGFCATIFADKIGHARQLAVAPDGTVFVNTWSGRYYGHDKPHEDGCLRLSNVVSTLYLRNKRMKGASNLMHVN